MQLQVESRLVDPFTVAANTCVVAATTVDDPGTTETVTWFAPPPLQLLIHTAALATSISTAAFLIARTFMTNVSLIVLHAETDRAPIPFAPRMPKNRFAAAYLSTSGLP